MPLNAIAIANHQRLSRIVVLKSLSKQMTDTMTQRLGGLVDRRIYFMPFSRKVCVDERLARNIQLLYEQCMETGGILLAHPEHILSFKLSGVERLVSGDLTLASQLMQTQQWLDIHARDIIDESDEVLDVKFQLVYSLGTQRMMDGQPDRWITIEEMFSLVKNMIPDLQKQFPDEMEVTYKTSSSFPAIRLLSSEVGEAMILKLSDDITASRLPGLSLENSSRSIVDAVRAFVLDLDVDVTQCRLIQDRFGHQDSILRVLLQIRGFLGHKIILHVIQAKRWSVNYGLDLTRCMSAVPYRAKGVPAPSAEFGHPDVAVALTCLSYYYAGLTNDQIRHAFEHLARADDPSREYAAWIQSSEITPGLPLTWAAVNLENDLQCRNILFPSVAYCKKTVDYYLTNVLFPREGKEFDEKLSTSGWDIPSVQGGQMTTGFSGTNDNQFVLPLSISQQDLPELRHTSARVLDYILRDENLFYHCLQMEKTQQVSGKQYIEAIHGIDRSIKVIIDVGAQILDVQNAEFVKAWMAIDEDAKAGIFFDEDDNAMVLTRNEKLEKLSISSFQSRMQDCVVYFDEVHTRGADLKLPYNARAAVTLGPCLTKDRMVQGEVPSSHLAGSAKII